MISTDLAYATPIRIHHFSVKFSLLTVRKASSFQGALILPGVPLSKLRHTVCCSPCRATDLAPREHAIEAYTMPTSHSVQDARKDQPALLSVSHLVQDEGITVQNGPIWRAVWVVAGIFAGLVLLFTANGCIATRGWVQDQLKPISSQLGQTDAKADRALAGLQNLHLEKQLVLDSSHGPTFAFGSAVLTENAKREIDGFFDDLDGSTNSASASGRLFVVAGHTDTVGSEDYNYELGQQRAERVAGYLIGKDGVDPMQIRVVSYGARKPIADNTTSRGRRSNRRVEILVYKEKIATGS
jgi:outer membrane protein OmpA-like peptidoglycan-associated protein